MAPTKVLVVDDEPGLVSLLKMWLESDGYEVHTAADGREALRQFFEHRPALSVTDLRMPDMDGFELITRIREVSEGGVLVLSALDAEDQMVRGLELGADEYLVKPMTRRVFLANVRALLRRIAPQQDDPGTYSDRFLTLNHHTHEAQVRGQPIHLRPTEFRLIAYLAQNRGRVISHQELLDGVWGNQGGSLYSLKWYISSLREKIEAPPAKPRLIVNVPRVGYRYSPEGPDSGLERQATAP